AIGVDAERAVPLRQLGAVGPVDQRNVGIDRLRPAHAADDGELAEGIVEVIVTAYHVSYAHVVVVHHDRQHVGRCAVRAEQDEIVDLGVLDRDAALDAVFDHGLALARGLEADDEGAFALFGGIAPWAFDPERAALGLRAFALRGELFLAHPALVGVAAGEEFVRHFGVTSPELRLVVFVAIPIEAEPAHAIENGVDRFLG